MATSTLTVLFVVASAVLLAYLAWSRKPRATSRMLSSMITVGFILRMILIAVIAFALLMSGSPYLIGMAWLAILFAAAIAIGYRNGEDVI